MFLGRTSWHTLAHLGTRWHCLHRRRLAMLGAYVSSASVCQDVPTYFYSKMAFILRGPLFGEEIKNLNF
jgi:hypothetical protein